ncbi:MAG: TonB-dependent receptor [Bacteroidota bacterium]
MLKNSLRYVLLLFSMAWATHGLAQSVQVSGYVKDANSGEPLLEASVSVASANIGTWTNKAGYFHLSLPQSQSHQLLFSYAGYQSQTLEIAMVHDTLLSVSLFAQVLDTVTISAAPFSPHHTLSMVEIPIAHIQQMPALFGETDVLKAFQLMPGVQGGTEGAAGLYVRGGSPDQNLILLDDVPLYYVNHAGGFISLFDADALGHVRMYKGSFPARYGGRLSSVLDLRIKEGNKQAWNKQLSLGILSTKLLVEGPIRQDTSALLVSGRFSNLGPLSWGLFQLATEANTQAWYTFYDLYAQYSQVASLNDRLYFSMYMGRDGLTSQVRSTFSDDLRTERSVSRGGIGWGNQMAAFRWQHLYHPRLFHHLTLAFTRFNYETVGRTQMYDVSAGNTLINDARFRTASGIQDWVLKLDYEYFPTPNWEVKFGGAIHQHTFRPGVVSFQTQGRDASLGARVIPSWEGNLYGEVEGSIGSRLRMNVGAHASAYYVDQKTYASLQPRVFLQYRLSDQWRWEASYASMQQYLHLLTQSNIGLPSDLWVPATGSVPPQQAHQWGTGLGWEWPGSHGLRLQLEGFYKTMTGLIDYREGGSVQSLQSGWEQQIESGGHGTVTGVEFLIQKQRGATTGWVGYTLSWNQRQFPNLNEGKAFPFAYDRRHVIQFSGNHTFSPRFSLSMNWVYMSGRPLTFALGRFPTIAFPQTPNEPVFFTAGLYQERNALRMPDYHRFDLSLVWTKSLPKGERQVSLGAYNLYNRQNPFFFFFYQPTNQADPELSQFTLFPLLPFLSWRRQF